jgi:hypothetical protein
MTPLLELGVKHTRSSLGTNPRIMTVMQPFFRTGGKHCVILHDTGTKLDKIASRERLDFVVRSIGPRNIDAIEGPNELNEKMDNWAAKLRDYAQWMHGAVRSIPALNHVKLIAPSMIGYKREIFSAGRQPQPLGGSKQHPLLIADFGRPRRFGSEDSGGRQGGRKLGRHRPSHGVLHAGPNAPLSKWVLTPRAAAKYMTRGWFDLFAAGVERSYI